MIGKNLKTKDHRNLVRAYLFGRYAERDPMVKKAFLHFEKGARSVTYEHALETLVANMAARHEETAKALNEMSARLRATEKGGQQ